MKRFMVIVLAVSLLSLLMGCGQIVQPATTPTGDDSPRSREVWRDPSSYVGQEVIIEGVLEAEGQGRDVRFFLCGPDEARLEVSAWAPLEVVHPPNEGTPTPKTMLDFVGQKLRLTGVVDEVGDGYILTVSQAEELLEKK
jgi:hypothetical protein